MTRTKGLQAAVQPLARVGVRVYATWRLNSLVGVGLNAVTAALPVPGLGFVLSTGVRLWVAAVLSRPPPGQVSRPWTASQAFPPGPQRSPLPCRARSSRAQRVRHSGGRRAACRRCRRAPRARRRRPPRCCPPPSTARARWACRSTFWARPPPVARCTATEATACCGGWWAWRPSCSCAGALVLSVFSSILGEGIYTGWGCQCTVPMYGALVHSTTSPVALLPRALLLFLYQRQLQYLSRPAARRCLERAPGQAAAHQRPSLLTPAHAAASRRHSPVGRPGCLRIWWSSCTTRCVGGHRSHLRALHRCAGSSLCAHACKRDKFRCSEEAVLSAL